MASFFYTQQDTQAEEPAPRRGLKLVKGVTRQVASAAIQRPSDLGAHGDSAWSSSLGQRRAEVQPPTLFSRSRPAWKRWLVGAWQWLWDLDDDDMATPLQGLAGVKNEFHTALWDLQSIRANQVRDQITHARSLRELWHLRADVFRVVALHRGQSEAEMRMESLDAHFPIRASRRAEDIRNTKVTTW
ncbi:MAG: hypothetical protein ACM3VZ_16055 [Acidobacteriota bacterium]